MCNFTRNNLSESFHASPGDKKQHQTKKPAQYALAFSSGETGTRTQATVARRQISNLLRYHSGTSPSSRCIHRRSGDKVTIKPCENNKNAYLTTLKNSDRNTLTISTMKKVLILSVFAFFAFAANAQSDASTSSKSTTSQVAQSKKDAGSSSKDMVLGGVSSEESSKMAKTSSCSKDAKSGSKDGKASCGKSQAACCSSKTADAGEKKGASCCSGKSAESCSKGKKEGEGSKKE